MTSISGLVIKNNILRNFTNYNIDTDSEASYTGDYNCFDENCDFTEDGGSTTLTFAQWQTATSQEANSLNQNPLMVDPANENFRIQTSSPCLNKGIDVGLTQDYLGNAVPFPRWKERPDIGAYEMEVYGIQEGISVEIV